VWVGVAVEVGLCNSTTGVATSAAVQAANAHTIINIMYRSFIFHPAKRQLY
jgi:hypothetical protein